MPVSIATQSGPPNLAGMTRAELQAALAAAEICAPEKAKMRAGQAWRWIHHYGVTDFARMTDIAKETRAAMAERFTLARPEVTERQQSADGVVKWLIRFAPGIEVETVFIPDIAHSGALCVSSQVGCTLNCSFCHTGTQGLVRNLTAAEIVAQVQVARDDLGEWPTSLENRRLSNIVFMGMGEPLANYERVWEAVERIHSDMGISARHVTVSTVGVVPGIRKLTHERLPVNPPQRLIIADPGLRGPLGHHLGYSLAVAQAARAQGILPLVLTSADFRGVVPEGVEFRPSFAAPYQTAGGRAMLRRILFGLAAHLPMSLSARVVPALRRARRGLRRRMHDGFAKELMMALAIDGDVSRDLLLLHSASAANLAGLRAALGES